MDATWYIADIGSSAKGLPNIFLETTTNKIETLSIRLCFTIYTHRFSLLTEDNVDSDSDKETDCSDSYSLYDTSLSGNSSSDSESDF